MYNQYNNLAQYYDQIYHFKDYRKEADKIKGPIQKYKLSKARALGHVNLSWTKRPNTTRQTFQEAMGGDRGLE